MKGHAHLLGLPINQTIGTSYMATFQGKASTSPAKKAIIGYNMSFGSTIKPNFNQTAPGFYQHDFI